MGQAYNPGPGREADRMAWDARECDQLRADNRQMAAALTLLRERLAAALEDQSTLRDALAERDQLIAALQDQLAAAPANLLTQLTELRAYLDTTATKCWRAGLGTTTTAAFARGQEKACRDALRRLDDILADHVTVRLSAVAEQGA
jgi:hypothetical protein